MPHMTFCVNRSCLKINKVFFFFSLGYRGSFKIRSSSLSLAPFLWVISDFVFLTCQDFCFPSGSTAFSLSRLHEHTHLDKHTLRRTPLDEGSVRRRDLYRQHTTLTTDIHTPGGFEPAIPPTERPQTARPLGFHWSRYRRVI